MIVDSVLRTKFGVAKTEGIQIDTSIRIPKQMQLDYGDIGVLYGNLLDNAIEACRKIETEKRFIRIENKFTAGKMLLVIENSKIEERNISLRTTKKDNYSHGRGIHSVRNNLLHFGYSKTICWYTVSTKEKEDSVLCQRLRNYYIS